MAVDSVMAQTLPASEIIIVDDQSDPAVFDKMSTRWADHGLISLHRLPQKGGVSHARNVGMKRSTGDYILFLDDDDMLLPDMLEKCIDAFDAADIVGCRTRMISDDAQLSKSKIKSYRWGYSKKAEVYPLDEEPVNHLLLHAPSIHSFLGKASILRSMDFDESLNYGEDLDYWVRLALQGARFHKTEFEGAIYRMHRKNASVEAVLKRKRQYYDLLLSNIKLYKTSKSILRMKLALVLSKDHLGLSIVWLIRAAFSTLAFNRHFWFFVRLYMAGRF
jgi:glycosyltransferase involved in cell wall biosynthesis